MSKPPQTKPRKPNVTCTHSQTVSLKGHISGPQLVEYLREAMLQKLIDDKILNPSDLERGKVEGSFFAAESFPPTRILQDELLDEDFLGFKLCLVRKIDPVGTTEHQVNLLEE